MISADTLFYADTEKSVTQLSVDNGEPSIEIKNVGKIELFAVKEEDNYIWFLFESDGSELIQIDSYKFYTGVCKFELLEDHNNLTLKSCVENIRRSFSVQTDTVLYYLRDEVFQINSYTEYYLYLEKLHLNYPLLTPSEVPSNFTLPPLSLLDPNLIPYIPLSFSLPPSPPSTPAIAGSNAVPNPESEIKKEEVPNAVQNTVEETNPEPADTNQNQEDIEDIEKTQTSNLNTWAVIGLILLICGGVGFAIWRYYQRYGVHLPPNFSNSKIIPKVITDDDKTERNFYA